MVNGESGCEMQDARYRIHDQNIEVYGVKSLHVTSASEWGMEERISVPNAK